VSGGTTAKANLTSREGQKVLFNNGKKEHGSQGRKRERRLYQTNTAMKGAFLREEDGI